MSAQHWLAEVFIGTSVLCWLLMVALIVMFARLRTARRHYAELQESFAQGGRGFRIQTARLTDAHGVIRSLEATVADTSRLLTDAQGTIVTLEARLTLPEPTPADLVLLDAAVRPERLTDAPMAAPDGCRVETVLHRPQTVLRGPRGRFVKVVVGAQGERTPADAFVVGRDRKDGWA